MPTTSAISSYSTNSTILGATSNGTSIVTGQSVDTDMFLKLLVAQMSNQDPFAQDQDPTKYITQLAQFSTLEQMQSMNSSLENLYAVTNGVLVNSAVSTATTTIGKEVEFSLEDGTNNTFSGTVKSVYVEDGLVYLEAVNSAGESKSFKFESILKING